MKTGILTVALVLPALIIAGCASSGSAAGSAGAEAADGLSVRVLLSYDEDEAYLKSTDMGVLNEDGSLTGPAFPTWAAGGTSSNTTGIEASGLAGSKAGYVIVNDTLAESKAGGVVDNTSDDTYGVNIAFNADEFNAAVTDWKGAEYFQFYVKNGGETISIDRIDIADVKGMNGNGYGMVARCKKNDKDNPEAYNKYQTRVIGSGEWTEQTFEASQFYINPDIVPFIFGSIVIEPNFEGFIRIKLEDVWALDKIWKQFKTWNEGRAVIQAAMFICAESAPGSKLIVDDLAIVGKSLHYAKGAVPEAAYFGE